MRKKYFNITENSLNVIQWREYVFKYSTAHAADSNTQRNEVKL